MKLHANKYLFAALLFFISFTQTAVASQINVPYDQVVFFGDSLTDNGNLYKSTLGLIPKSPPYFNGRFSDGNVWSDHIAAYYASNNITSTNYAVGGETVVLHNPVGGYLPYILSQSITSYLLSTIFRDKSHTLYIIWIGANDYLHGASDSDVEQATSDVVDTIKSNIQTLIANGGKYFLVINLPDMAKTPMGQTSGREANLTALTLSNNMKLDTAVAQIQKDNPAVNIHLFDIYGLFNDLIANTAKYNEKYHTHITNVKDDCWKGGMTFRQMQYRQEAITQQLRGQFKTLSITIPDAEKIDANQLASYIAGSPDLSSAYAVGERYSRGEVACNNPDDYLFWDFVHPSAVAHGILSNIIIDYINQAFHR